MKSDGRTQSFLNITLCNVIAAAVELLLFQFVLGELWLRLLVADLSGRS